MYATHTHHFFRREEDGMVRSTVKRVDGVSLQGHLHALNNEGFHEDVKRTTRHIQCASNLVEALKTTKKSRRSGRYPPQTDEGLTIGSSNNFDRREGSTGINARPSFHCNDNNAPRRPALPPIDLRFHNHRNASQLVSTGTSSPPSPSSSTTTSSATSPSHACLSACAVLTKANVSQLPFLSAPPPCPRTCHCPASASLARPSIPQTRRSPNRLPGTYTGKLATIHNVHNNDPTAGSVQSTSLPRIAPLSFTPPPPPFSNFYPGRTLQFSASLRSYRLLHGVGGLDHCKPQTHVMAAQALSSSGAAPKVAVKIVQQAWIQRHASPSPPFSPLAAPFLPSICRPVGELEAVRLLSYSSVHPNVMPVLDVEQDKRRKHPKEA
ncbi:hypothetical protein NGA_0185000 [Nannochloropsis gaditana CCMP526]|uniref:uncharacterized protein n=1 Tax=Nannochloropsis gaditana (strain CCMP526) TaxID=1093141 RepID=UPI00029F7CB1|nr:hypothetical protein NGA_0185000 [Nannochloropsis gaditana CCMP526]EKU21675.1 hypothetical protein NGA_0185000 [Nannochloropsis gaditana CCMP526]|eukprot:XP_005854682.1 hypothetical protein NGA_0185000 [Nannochloropsis gaditana CCMP526]